MDVLFGLVSAIGWGSTYFLTRIPARIIGTLRTVLYFQIISFAMLTLYVLVTDEWQVLLTLSGSIWLWIFISAMGNTFSVIADFRAIQIGVLSIVTPITANYAIITVVFAMMSGESLSQLQWGGILCAAMGIILITARRYDVYGTDRTLVQGILWALLAAGGYGFSYWVIGQHVAPHIGGILPVWTMRINSIFWLILLILMRPQRKKIAWKGNGLWWALTGMALLDNIGTSASFIGYATTNVSIVTVVASMYTVVTIFLARIFYKENLVPQQWLGIVSIICAITLISM